MSPEARLAQGFAAHRAGRFAEALADYRAVLALAPDHVDALALAASATRSAGDLAGALDLFARAAARAPERADLFYNWGNALSAAGDPAAAVDAYRRTIALTPDAAEAHANLALALARLGDPDGAEAAYRTALARDPDHRMAGLNLANLIGERGRADESLARLRALAARAPDLAEARYDLALALLRAGDWTNGFAAYEARWRTPSFSSPIRHAEVPDWDGRPLDGGRLLVHAEQGLGDTIQFARLLPLAASLRARITFEVPTVLLRLLAGIAGAEEVTDRVEPGAFAAEVPLLGLPHRLRLTLGAIPPTPPSLAVAPDRVARWRDRLAADGRSIVAVVWRGNPNSPADRGRSLAGPHDLAGLARPGRRLLALQKLAAAELEAHDGPTGWRVAATGDLPIEHPGPDFDAGAGAFLDTAAVLTLVDRVVTVDTAFAHLAGTLRRPTALLLKAVADWRWLEGRATTPWYPEMRLMRQTTPGDWTSPLAEAKAWLDGA